MEGIKALIKCPECGHQVSDKARSCPECGYPFGARRKNIGIKILRNIFEIVGLLSVIAGMVTKRKIFQKNNKQG